MTVQIEGITYCTVRAKILPHASSLPVFCVEKLRKNVICMHFKIPEYKDIVIGL